MVNASMIGKATRVMEDRSFHPSEGVFSGLFSKNDDKAVIDCTRQQGSVKKKEKGERLMYCFCEI